MKNTIISFILLLLVTLPRFNGNQTFVKQVSYDAKYFESYVKYWRGEALTQPLRPATNWRMLSPFVASFLPFEPLTAINILNILFLLGSLTVFYFCLKLLNIQIHVIWQSIWLFIVSFPTFYYSCIGYVDPAAIFFISLGIYAVLKDNFLLFCLSLFVGLLAKETVALLLPFSIVYFWFRPNKKLFYLCVLAAFLFASEYLLIRAYAPISEGQKAEVFWSSSYQSIQTNLHRTNTWLSLLFTLFPIGILLVIKHKNTSFKYLLNQPIFAACLAGISCAIGLFIMSFCTTIADGRAIWQSYFFMLLIYCLPGEKSKGILNSHGNKN